MGIKTFLATPVAAAIAMSSAALCAQETSTSDSQSMLIPIMVQGYKGYAQELPTSGSKTDAEWLDVPQSVSVVTDTEMQDRGAVRLVDALDGVAGVNNTLGEGSRDQFVIRGFDAIRDVYRDGLRDDGNLQSYRSLANVEQVEVVKGPAGALYGRGSAGGIINLVTKRANGDEFTRLGTSYGSHNQMTGSIDSSGKLSDTINGRINAEIRQSDSFVDHVDSEDYFIAPTLQFNPSEGHVVNLDLEFMHQELVPYRGIPSNDGKPVDVSRSTYFGSLNDYQESDSMRIAIEDELALTPDVTWHNRAVYNRVTLEQRGTRQATTPVSDTGEVAQTVNTFGYDPRTTQTLQSELEWQLDNHQLLFGADYNQIDIDLNLARTNLPTKDIYSPIATSAPNPGFPAFRENTTKTLGLYLQDMITVGDWSFTGNVRQDRMELDQTTAAGVNSSNDDNKTSYRLGAVYRLTDDMSAYTTLAKSWQLPYGGSFVSPTLAEFFSTELMEIGAKAYLLDDALMLNAAVFQIEQEQPQTDADGFIVDKSRARHQGIELEMRGQITEQLSATASYTYMDAEDRDTGKKPNDVSDHLAALGATYQLDDAWRFGASIKYVGDRFAGNNEAVALGDYTLVDAMASYHVGKHRIQLNAYNLFDEEYYLGSTNGTSGVNSIGYGAPAEFMVSYHYEL
ncbi:Catecholate siderophore receptor Fiu precursor [Marinomonas aquimarina]|uniref:Catecholate siderophore receptor Fiu n=1 Tax=Marinomonas aquimarina TaxID=295068 RepID=A0A1A8TD91_9GAMM|nr:TonB-dependent receptor [Marinomonas aquimarina]SBS30767.1 Catecholate siderophore receptor Fiu precursor [Marinomonas aquimarina]